MVLHYLRAFPSDCIPKTTKDVNVHFCIQSEFYSNFPHTSIPVNYTKEFQGLLKLLHIIDDNDLSAACVIFKLFWLYSGCDNIM